MVPVLLTLALPLSAAVIVTVWPTAPADVPVTTTVPSSALLIILSTSLRIIHLVNYNV